MAEPAIVIRPATEGDATAIANLMVQVQELHVRQHPEVFRAMTHAQAVEVLASALSQPGFVVARRQWEICGYAKYVWHNRPENAFVYASRALEVDQICVDASMRARGIGRALLRWLEDFARDNGGGRVQLNHWITNDVAARAFAAAGYEPYVQRVWKPV